RRIFGGAILRTWSSPVSSSNTDPPREAANSPNSERGPSEAGGARSAKTGRSTTEFRPLRPGAEPSPSRAATATVAASLEATGDLGDRRLGEFRLLRRLGRGG